jgi:hypothetical protein
MTFLKVLLIIIIAYYALKYLLSLIMPWLLKKLANHVQRKFEDAQKQTWQNTQTTRDGEVRVEGNGSQKKKMSDASGDYIDFEEVKD